MDPKDTAKTKAIRQFIGDNLPTTVGEKELVIRTGEAERVLYPNKVRLNGTISAPANFYEKRKSLHNPNLCHVVFDKATQILKLVVDEQFSERNYEIVGKVEDNPDLNAFSINAGGDTFTVKELMNVLKFNRVHFKDKDDNHKIVLALQNFKAKVEKTLEDSSNLRGNEAKVQITKLEHDLQESFMLQMPIFKGGETKTFKVDICVQVSNGSVVVWLESRDLKDLQVTGVSAIMDAELAKFTDIVCIEQ
jgi:hypothetical protein